MKADEKNLLSIAEQAAEWFLRLPTATPEERREFMCWLRESPAHVSELLQAAMWDKVLSDARLEYPLDADALVEQARGNIIELDASAREASVFIERSRRSVWRWRVAAAAAAVMLAALLSFAAKVAWFERAIETDTAEWRTQPLADGSVVHAGPNTQMRFAFGDDVRLVYFARGEALFDVASDRHRPFAVRTDVADIRATGTQFGLARRDGQIVVTVADGSVVVARGKLEARDVALRNSPQDVAGITMMTLEAGEQLSISPSGALVAHAVDTRVELAWADQRLIFVSGTVADAVREFNVRNRTQISIDDPGIARAQIRGLFDASDPRSFAAMVAQHHGASLRAEAGTLHLSGRATRPAVRHEPEVER